MARLNLILEELRWLLKQIMDATLCMYVGVGGGGEAMILGKGNRFLRGACGWESGRKWGEHQGGVTAP